MSTKWQENILGVCSESQDESQCQSTNFKSLCVFSHNITDSEIHHEVPKVDGNVAQLLTSTNIWKADVLK